MIFSVDHIVFATTARQRDELMNALCEHGFLPEQFTLEFPEIGASSESLSYAGGGFVEFVGELDSELSPDVWFDETPRVIGLGFASDAFEDDTAGWTQTDAWRMSEDHVLPSGSVLNIHAAGPHHHLSDFYVFVMDRDAGALEFPTTSGTPRLKEIRLQGHDAVRWRRDLAAWLRLDAADGSLYVGDVTLTFDDGPPPGVRATLGFAGQVDAATTIPLASGSVTIWPQDD